MHIRARPRQLCTFAHSCPRQGPALGRCCRTRHHYPQGNPPPKKAWDIHQPSFWFYEKKKKIGSGQITRKAGFIFRGSGSIVGLGWRRSAATGMTVGLFLSLVGPLFSFHRDNPEVERKRGKISFLARMMGKSCANTGFLASPGGARRRQEPARRGLGLVLVVLDMGAGALICRPQEVYQQVLVTWRQPSGLGIRVPQCMRMAGIRGSVGRGPTASSVYRYLLVSYQPSP